MGVQLKGTSPHLAVLQKLAPATVPVPGRRPRGGLELGAEAREGHGEDVFLALAVLGDAEVGEPGGCEGA